MVVLCYDKTKWSFLEENVKTKWFAAGVPGDLLFSVTPLHTFMSSQESTGSIKMEFECKQKDDGHVHECKKADEKNAPDQDVLCMHMHQLAVKDNIRRYNSQLITTGMWL